MPGARQRGFARGRTLGQPGDASRGQEAPPSPCRAGPRPAPGRQGAGDAGSGRPARPAGPRSPTSTRPGPPEGRSGAWAPATAHSSDCAFCDRHPAGPGLRSLRRGFRRRPFAPTSRRDPTPLRPRRASAVPAIRENAAEDRSVRTHLACSAMPSATDTALSWVPRRATPTQAKGFLPIAVSGARAHRGESASLPRAGGYGRSDLTGELFPGASGLTRGRRRTFRVGTQPNTLDSSMAPGRYREAIPRRPVGSPTGTRCPPRRSHRPGRRRLAAPATRSRRETVTAAPRSNGRRVPHGPYPRVSGPRNRSWPRLRCCVR